MSSFSLRNISYKFSGLNATLALPTVHTLALPAKDSYGLHWQVPSKTAFMHTTGTMAL